MNTTTKKIVALPLRPVYCRHDALTVGKKLDLGRKNELWGIELPSNIIPALKCTEKKEAQTCRGAELLPKVCVLTAYAVACRDGTS